MSHEQRSSIQPGGQSLNADQNYHNPQHLTSDVAALAPSLSAPLRAANSPNALASATDAPPSQGPLNRSWDPPPRAKPGRKPMSDNPIDKRKTQNRASQRAFRERKAEQIRKAETDASDLKRGKEELQQRCRTLEDSCQKLQRGSTALEKLLAEKQQEIEALRSELDTTNDRLVANQRLAVTSSSNTSFKIAMESEHAPANPQAHLSPMSPPASLSVSGGCGKCEDSGECPCVDEYLKMDIEDADSFSSPVPPHSSAPIPVDFTSSLRRTEPATPGSCSRCKTDPRQKVWCMNLARRSQQRQTQSVDAIINATSQALHHKTHEPPILSRSSEPLYVNCSQAYPILETAGHKSEALQDPSWMKTVLIRTKSPEDEALHSPMEVELASALTALSRHDRRESTSQE